MTTCIRTFTRINCRAPLGLNSRPNCLQIPRALHTTATCSYPRKDSQSKDSLKTETTEYTQSSTSGDQEAAHQKPAFDPSQTSPEEQLDTAGKEKPKKGEVNPLEASPANKDISEPRDQTEGGAQSSPSASEGRRKQSVRGGGESKGRKI
ncbi:MAG: hypothetical protein M1834_001752 [Cirrosporium novae-zelandiae]|nr:MAG: hypothetical protein M1834_001752 [Cirrosporium novae-zelandiae]